MPGRAHTFPDRDILEKAKASVSKQYPDLTEDDERFWKIVSTVYKNMGGTLSARAGHGDASVRLFYDSAAPSVVERTDDGRSRSWVKVFPLGMTILYNGRSITFDRKLLAAFERNFRSEGVELNASYNHYDTDDDATLDQQDSAGDVVDVELRGDGFWALVNWTAEAAERIRGGTWKRVSGEFHLDFEDKHTGDKVGPKFLGLALVNRPFIEREMPRVAARELTSEDGSGTGVRGREDHMPKLIHAALKLSENATEEQIVAAIAEQAKRTGEAEAKLSEATAKLSEAQKEREATAAKLADTEKARGAADAGKSAAEVQLKELDGKVAKLSESLIKLETEKREAVIAAEVARLRDGGFILPAQFEATMAWGRKDLDGLKAFFKDAKPVVEFGERGATHREDRGENSPAVLLAEKTAEVMAKDKCSWEAAFAKVSAENPAAYQKLSESYRENHKPV